METLLSFGGAVRSLGGGRFEAPLVTFTDPTAPDLYGTYFTRDTEFWTEFPARLPLLYGHGLDATLRLRRLGLDTPMRGSVETSLTDAGVWMQGQLDLRDEYELAIYALIEAGKIGTSSGSASHLIEETAVPGSEARHMASWPLIEASLTPIPAEPSHVVQPVRSVLSLLQNNPLVEPGTYSTELPRLRQAAIARRSQLLKPFGGYGL